MSRNTIFAQNFSRYFEEWKKQDSGRNATKFAKLIYSNRVSVSKWKNGNAYPTEENMKRICEVLHVSEDQLTDASLYKKAYTHDSHFTENLHHRFQKYCDCIGIESDFMKFAKSAVPDEEFPLWSPIVETGDLLNIKYHRQSLASAFESDSSNEFQRSIDGKTVNLCYADFQFLREVQEDVKEFIRFKYYQRKHEMESEVSAVQTASEETVNGVKITSSISPEKYDRFMEYQTTKSVNRILEGKNHGKEK